MGTETWIVRGHEGNEWGLIKRLILDSTTKQISYADVVLTDTGQLIRLPWENFDVEEQGITLRISEGQVDGVATRVWDTRMPKSVAMDLWP